MDPLDTEPSNLRQPDAGGFFAVLFKSAVEAWIQTWLVLLLGGIAFSLVGGIFQEMLPSAPPGFTHQVVAESDGLHPSLWDAGWGAVKHHRFWLLFGVLLGLTAWTRLAPHDPSAMPGTTSQARRLLGRLSEDWFGLLVGNAFGAMISAMVVVWLGFSFEKWLLKEALDWFISAVHPLFQSVFGESQGGVLPRWWHWFGSNQLKFTFWFLYIGAICDDLGLPNVKTLVRFLWRRIRCRMLTPPPIQEANPSADTPPTQNQGLVK